MLTFFELIIIDDNQYVYLIVHFMVCFSGISDEFGRAMVHILVRCSWAKIPMTGPKKPDMSPKCTKWYD